MVVDILELVDKLDDRAASLRLELEGAVSADIVLKTLISRHMRDKQR
jgi:hypothetical protein